MKFQKDNDLDLYAYITCKKQSLYDTIIFIYINAEWMRRKSIENLYLYNFHITCLGQVLTRGVHPTFMKPTHMCVYSIIIAATWNCPREYI